MLRDLYHKDLIEYCRTLRDEKRLITILCAYAAPNEL